MLINCWITKYQEQEKDYEDHYDRLDNYGFGGRGDFSGLVGTLNLSETEMPANIHLRLNQNDHRFHKCMRRGDQC